jgi:hypothetical protein
MDLDMYLSVIDFKPRKTEDTLMRYNARSTDPAAIALEAGKVDHLQQVRASLVSPKTG